MEEVKQNQSTQPKNKMQILHSFLSQKKVSIIIGIVIVVIVILILALFAVFSNSKKAVNTYQYHPLSGSILFEPATISAIPGQATSAAIMINTGGNPIVGAEIAVQYNPKVLENVALTPFKDPHSAIANSLEATGSTFNDGKGGLILTLRLPSNIPAQPGVGQIATVTFTPKIVNVAINSAVIQVSSVSNFFVSSTEQPINSTKNVLQINFTPQVPSPTASGATR